MAYSNHRIAGRGYRVSGRDMLSHGFKYGQPWAEDRRALERAFRQMDIGTRASGSEWATPTSTYERRTRDSGGSADNNTNDQSQVVRFGGNKTSSTGRHRSVPTPSLEVKPQGNHRRDRNRIYTGAVMAGRAPSSTAYPSSDNSWDLESPYGYDYHDWDASSQYSTQSTLYTAGTSHKYRTQRERYGDHEVHGSYGHHPTSINTQGSTYYSGSGSTMLSDSDGGYGSDSSSRYSEYTAASEYAESSYLDGEDGESYTYISDDHYSNSSGEETYDSDGVFTGSVGDDESDVDYFGDDTDGGDSD